MCAVPASRLQYACREAAPQYHRLLLDAYTSSMLPTISEEEAFAFAPPSSSTHHGGSADPQQQQQQRHPQQQRQHGKQHRQQYHWPPAASQPAAQLPPQKLQALPDDGYILINLGHHLVGAGRHHQVGGWITGSLDQWGLLQA